MVFKGLHTHELGQTAGTRGNKPGYKKRQTGRQGRQSPRPRHSPCTLVPQQSPHSPHKFFRHVKRLTRYFQQAVDMVHSSRRRAPRVPHRLRKTPASISNLLTVFRANEIRIGTSDPQVVSSNPIVYSGGQIRTFDLPGYPAPAVWAGVSRALRVLGFGLRASFYA